MATTMRNVPFLPLLFAVISLTWFSCENETSAPLPEEEGLPENPSVYIIFPPNGPGDNGFLDKLMSATTEYAIEHPGEVRILLPEDSLQAEIVLSVIEYATMDESQKDTALTVFIGSEYKEILYQASHPEGKQKVLLMEDDGEGDEPDSADVSLLEWKEELTDILQNRNRSIADRAAAVLYEAEMTIPEKTVSEWADVYLELERLDESWTEILEEMKETDISSAPALDTPEWETAFEQLLVYFLYRQLPFALDDGEYEGRAAFAVLSYQIIRDLCAVHAVRYGSVDLDDLVEICRQYSAEIEYSDQNVDALLDVLFEE